MGWKIIFAPQAIAQLEQIVRFIAQDDPQAAIRFGNYLVDRAESLANFPELGTPYRKRPNVRRLLCKSYFIYYRLRREEQVIEIMDYWHSARREPRI
jgi:plasmid stabilization system protein ParE